MRISLFILAALAGLVLLLLLLFRGVVLRLYANERLLRLQVLLRLGFWRIPVFQNETTGKKLRKNILKSLLQKNKKKKKKASLSVKDINTLKKYLRLESFALQLSLGTGEADKTALLCGGIRSVVAPFAAQLLRKGKKAAVNISPVFEKQALLLNAECIFSVKIVHIIFAWIKIKRRVKKHGKASH